MTLAATLCTAAVAERLNGPLMHGPTFMANPLATAAALASTGLLGERDVAAGCCADRSAALPPGWRRAGRSPGEGRDRRDRARPRGRRAARDAAAVEHGVWLRPFRNLIYAMPPYVTDDDDVARITEAMVGMRVVVTGTDTGVGKTYVSAALAARHGLREGRADRRRRRRRDRARAVRRRGAHARAVSRAAGARDRGRARGRAGITPREIADFVETLDRRRGRRGRRRAARALRRRDDRRRGGTARRAADRRRPRGPRHAQPHGA